MGLIGVRTRTLLPLTMQYLTSETVLKSASNGSVK